MVDIDIIDKTIHVYIPIMYTRLCALSLFTCTYIPSPLSPTEFLNSMSSGQFSFHKETLQEEGPGFICFLKFYVYFLIFSLNDSYC